MGWMKRSTPSDTGTLDISGLATGMTAGAWTLRRVGNLVYMALSLAEFTPTSGSIWQDGRFVPTGFRPVAVPSYIYIPSAATRTSSSTSGMRINRYGGVDIYGVADKDFSTVCTWITDDEWPTNLPGVKI